jgi:hypothetical protein
MPDSPSQLNLPDSPWDDLVVSILAVNQYSLERTYALLQGLRREKLTDPPSLGHWEPHEIEARLRAAGCDRGRFMTTLFAERLSALGALIRAKGITECERILRSTDAKAIEALLLPVKGIGPVVLRNFYTLVDIPNK